MNSKKKTITKTSRKKSKEDHFLPGRNARPSWSNKQLKMWLAGENNSNVRSIVKTLLGTPPNKYTRL